MKLTLDIGNTAVKWALFEGRTMVETGEWKDHDERLEGAEIEQVAACASGADATLEGLRRHFASAGVPFTVLCAPYDDIPLTLNYKTPATLGADRVAAACGARALHPGEDCLVIDAGTCITVDFLDRQGTYHGGAIMPGLGMSLQALHTFTAKLPLVDVAPGRKAPVLGRSTEESIVAGTLGATTLALAGFVALYREKCPALRVLLTGGDAHRLDSTAGWEQAPHLTLIGLNDMMTQA